MEEQKKSDKKQGPNKAIITLIVILSVIVVGGAGFAIGKDKGSEQALQEYQQQIQKDLGQAKDVAADEISEGQNNAEELKAENAQLKDKVAQQEAKIADLEKQLEEASQAKPPEAQ